MGGAVSSGIDELSPPLPTHSTVFVVRNGRYEPQDWQNLMPRRLPSESLDFDGFAEQRGARNGQRVSRPPEMRQASLVQNPASVRRDSFGVRLAGPAERPCEILAADRTWMAWSCDEAGAATIAPRSEFGSMAGPAASDAEHGHAVLSFTFDTVATVKVSVHLLAREVEELDSQGVTSQVWLASQEASGSVVDTCSFEPGLGQIYRSPPLDVMRWSAAALAYDASQPKNVPVAVKLEAAAKEGASPSVQYTYVSLHGSQDEPQEERRLAAQVFAQKLQYGEQVFVLHELFGVSTALADEVEPDAGSGECIICLAEPRDTAVLPCRHMVFCSYCAGVARLQCDRCPVCRQKVSSLLQLRRPKEAPGEARA